MTFGKLYAIMSDEEKNLCVDSNEQNILLHILVELKNQLIYEVYYRVSTTSSAGYLPWVKNIEDYAGIFGKQIDTVQIEVKKIVIN